MTTMQEHAERARAPGPVRVLGVEVEPPDRTVPPGRRRVRAVVHLGELTPADVHVAIVPEPGLAGVAPADAPPVRLFSTRSYGNGAYVFEGCVATPLLRDLPPIEVEIRERS